MNNLVARLTCAIALLISISAFAFAQKPNTRLAPKGTNIQLVAFYNACTKCEAVSSKPGLCPKCSNGTLRVKGKEVWGCAKCKTDSNKPGACTKCKKPTEKRIMSYICEKCINSASIAGNCTKCGKFRKKYMLKKP